MKIAIVVRSYDKDFCWLEWLVRSIGKFVTGYDEAILITPIGHIPSREIQACFDRHIQTKEICTGYLAQQIDKLEAWRYTNCDMLLYCDSDCPFRRPFDARDRVVDGKPLLFRTHYRDIPEPAIKWQEVTRSILGFVPEYEYMRSQPMMHSAEILRRLSVDFPNLRSIAECSEQHLFSEFNVMGAYAAEFHPDAYQFSESPEYACLQYWSWGGMTDEIREELEQTIGHRTDS
jgi:hypothetical protein